MSVLVCGIGTVARGISACSVLLRVSRPLGRRERVGSREHAAGQENPQDASRRATDTEQRPGGRMWSGGGGAPGADHESEYCTGRAVARSRETSTM